ncbi:LysR family transcriptional regulator [Robbsia andropogonis]|uniref:LysR family transcriptional regulator n=1 Tax=Robbsia andropogonis TaxID=28092 RepID=UPI003D1CD733
MTIRPRLPLNALRAFESSARHESFTRAAAELSVTQAAVSQHVRALEGRLGVSLFKRLPRGLGVTDEGRALLLVLSDAFMRIENVLKQFEGMHARGGALHDVLTVGVVGTFAVGWLMPRLKQFRDMHPFIELRVMTHNNQVDVAAEGLDCAIRFGDGLWSGFDNVLLCNAPLTVLCTPELASRLVRPDNLRYQTLLRSYRTDEWAQWLEAAGLRTWTITGPMFDSSRLMVEAAMQGPGVALAPPSMFARELQSGALVRPFDTEIDAGGYWLTRPKTRGERGEATAVQFFQDWIIAQSATGG